MSKEDKVRVAQTLDRAIQPGVTVIIRRGPYHVRIGASFRGSRLEITRLVAAALGLTLDADGIRTTAKESVLALIEQLAVLCTNLYEVRLL